MKILNPEQIKQLDDNTIHREPISSIDLMERAAHNCVQWIIENYATNCSFKIFCGSGNNGGDGLAIGRILFEKDYSITVFVVDSSSKKSADFLLNEKRLTALGLEIKYLNEANIKTLDLDNNEVLIDALFGIGLNRKIEGISADLIRFVNQAKAEVIAIDMPSGLFLQASVESDEIIKANHTLTFQAAKLPLLFAENNRFVGAWHLIPIGLDQKFINELSTPYHLICKEVIKTIVKKRNKFSHKGTYGHALVIAGSRGKMGAAVLSNWACLSSGAGLVSAYVPKCGTTILQISLPEAMVIESSGESNIQLPMPRLQYDAIGIGPGIGQREESIQFLKKLLQDHSKPVVLDADALNILSFDKKSLKLIPKNSILSPHPKEFKRLVGDYTTSLEMLDKQVELANHYQIIVLVKGAHTSIALPDGSVYFNSTGNPGMATAGSGDVLTGILTGLLAQGYRPQEAAILGVYLHGLAGDLAAEKLGQEALLARDIIKNMGEAFKEIGFFV